MDTSGCTAAPIGSRDGGGTRNTVLTTAVLLGATGATIVPTRSSSPSPADHGLGTAGVFVVDFAFGHPQVVAAVDGKRPLADVIPRFGCGVNPGCSDSRAGLAPKGGGYTTRQSPTGSIVMGS